MNWLRFCRNSINRIPIEAVRSTANPPQERPYAQETQSPRCLRKSLDRQLCLLSGCHPLSFGCRSRTVRCSISVYRESAGRVWSASSSGSIPSDCDLRRGSWAGVPLVSLPGTTAAALVQDTATASALLADTPALWIRMDQGGYSILSTEEIQKLQSLRH